MATVVLLPGCTGFPETGLPALSPLPPAQQPRAPFRFTPRRASEIGLAGISVRLGIADRASRTIINKVRLLIDLSGFPTPKTPRFRCGKRLTGADAVDARSVWDRDQVEAWFEGDLPPDIAAAQGEAERGNLRARLAENARQMVGGAA